LPAAGTPPAASSLSSLLTQLQQLAVTVSNLIQQFQAQSTSAPVAAATAGAAAGAATLAGGGGAAASPAASSTATSSVQASTDPTAAGADPTAGLAPGSVPPDGSAGGGGDTTGGGGGGCCGGMSGAASGQGALGAPTPALSSISPDSSQGADGGPDPSLLDNTPDNTTQDTQPYADPTAPTQAAAVAALKKGSGKAGGKASGLGQQMVKYAEKFAKGFTSHPTMYLWGGTTPKGFDCSGLMLYVFKHFGINLPRTSQDQYKKGKPVAKGSLQPGDLVFFEKTSTGPGHVGMYIGGGKYINAPETGKPVQIASLSDSWSASNYMGARRYI
jgi:cell wall-associated NlpC family hydrolase